MRKGRKLTSYDSRALCWEESQAARTETVVSRVKARKGDGCSGGGLEGSGQCASGSARDGTRVESGSATIPSGKRLGQREDVLT